MGLIKSVTCCMIGEYTPDHDSIATMLCTYMIKMVLEWVLGVPLSLDSGNTKDTKSELNSGQRFQKSAFRL